MALIIWCAAVPIVLMLVVRKYRVHKWGWCKENSVLTNKCFIVTGANSGLGKETVKGLVSRKARVIMACRDMKKAKETIQEIRSSVKTGELIPMQLDLASLESIKKFSDEVKRDFPEIHVLINNAGVATPASLQQKTKDGFELNFGVNHLGHFYLTNLLLDKLKSSAPSRIIVVASTLHEKGVIDFNNLQGENGWGYANVRNPAYNNSKLANVYFCRELAKRLPEGVQTFSVCPGFCYTNLMRHNKLKWYQYLLFAPVVFFFMRTAEQGSQTILHCALSTEVDGHSGELFRDCQGYKSRHPFQDDIQQKLWRVSEELIAAKAH